MATLTELSHSLRQTLCGRYRIEAEIGRGGAAIVYRARDQRYERTVAVKVLRPELAASPDRFLREIRILAALQHPNITPLFDSGEVDGLPFFVMPFIEGESLRARLETHRPLSVQDAVDITRVVADALGYAHEHGFVHRDVKPENILICEGHPILTDFGIARAVQRSIQDEVTRTGYRIGTPRYMSPEQLLDDGDVDGRSDQYSLALVLYELLAGALPRGWDATPRDQQRRLALSRRDVPARVRKALLRALAPHPSDRFANMSVFAEALVKEPPPLLLRRHPLVGAGLVTAVMLGGALLAVRSWTPTRASMPTPPVLDPRRIAVLYLDDHSPDNSLAYLANGLTESLIHELSGVHGIEVVSRNGVKRFRNAPMPTDRIARLLRAGSIVEGSVQQSGGRVRVTVQLIDGATDTHVESRTIEHPTGELFGLEDDLAYQVSTLLRRRIGDEIRVRERQTATRSERARELELRADLARDDADRSASWGDTVALGSAISELMSADSLLRLAEQADPRWLEPTLDRGWVALEAASRQSGAQRERSYDTALAIASRALGRDRGSANALELRGTTLYYQALRLPLPDTAFSDRLSRAQSDLERALSLDSTLATAWGTLSRVRVARGEVGQAESDARVALTMDAYLADGPDVLLSLYIATLMEDSLASSWRWCERGAADYPQDVRFVECQLTLMAEDPSRRPNPARAESLLAVGDRLDPPAHARAAGRPWLPVYRQMLTAVVHARAADANRARAMAARARTMIGDDPDLRIDLEYEEAYLALILGDRRAALALLADYLASRPSLAGLVARHPRWRSLRTDPAFQALVRTRPPAASGGNSPRTRSMLPRSRESVQSAASS